MKQGQAFHETFKPWVSPKYSRLLHSLEKTSNDYIAGNGSLEKTKSSKAQKEEKCHQGRILIRELNPTNKNERLFWGF